MTKSEERKLEAKKREWDEAFADFKKRLAPWKRALKVAKREIDYQMTTAAEFYFGDKGVSFTRKWIRRCAIIFIDIILLRILGFI